MNLCHKPDVRNLIMPLLCVLGDGQSQDQLCCRIASYNPSTTDRLCWSCNCPGMETDNPDVKCQTLQQDEIQELVKDALDLYPDETEDANQKRRDHFQNPSIDCLNKYFVQVVDNAFFKTLNASNLFGIFGMSTVCIMSHPPFLLDANQVHPSKVLESPLAALFGI